jgi:hypothetical protein
MDPSSFKNYEMIMLNAFFKNIKTNDANTIKEEIKNSDGPENQQTTAPKKASNKCSVCNKKVPLATQFKCGCDSNKMFCINHRYPEEHSCTKEKEKIKLDKVVADKLQRI